MKTTNLVFLMLNVFSIAYSKNVELVPETFSTAQLTLIIDKTIKLNGKNKFSQTVVIDKNNRCTFRTNAVNLNLSKNTEWKSQSTIDWSDWDSKTYNFKLTHQNEIALLNCEMNLGGEILLFNENSGKKSANSCSRQGGRVQNSPPKSYTFKQGKNSNRAPASQDNQSYCVKKIPRVTLSQFKKAFRNANVKLSLEFSAESPDSHEY